MCTKPAVLGKEKLIEMRRVIFFRQNAHEERIRGASRLAGSGLTLFFLVSCRLRENKNIFFPQDTKLLRAVLMSQVTLHSFHRRTFD